MANSNTTTFLKGISIQTVFTLIMGILEMVVFSVLSRLLTKSDFGYYAALMGVIAISQAVSEAGLGSAIVQNKSSNERYVGTAFTLSVSLGVLITGLLWLFAPTISTLIADSTIVTPLRILSLVLIFNSFISVGNALLYRDLDFKRIGILQCISYVISATIGIIMAYLGLGIWSIVVYTVLYVFLNALLLFVLLPSRPSLGIHREYIGGIFSFGGWLTLSSLLNNFTQQIDKLLLSKLLSVEALGAYNRPSGFVSTISTKINSIFDTVLFPMLSSIQDEHNRIIDVYYRAIVLLNSFSVILFSVFFFNAELIISIFFGKNWLDLVPVLQIISISLVFSIDGRLVDCFFRSLNLVRIGFYIRLVGAIIMLIGIIVGARFGIIGVAASIVISNVLIIVIKMVVLNKKIHASLRTMCLLWIKALKPAIPIFIVGFVFLLFFSGSILYSIFFACIFCLILFFEFIIYPNSVGQEYITYIYPSIHSIILKLGLKKGNE